MHGGIWTLCIDLPLPELQELRRHPKFPPSAPTCLNYLAGSSENARGEEQRNDWQHSKYKHQNIKWKYKGREFCIDWKGCPRKYYC